MKLGNAFVLKDTGKILHNRFVLYFVLFLALADLFVLTSGGDYISVAIFILTGFVTSFFSKNMMVIMCIAMVITNIMKYGTNVSMQEGLDNGSKPKADGETKPKADGETKPKTDGETKPKADGEMKPKADGETKPKPKEIILTEEEKRKFTENMEKLETYEPLFTSMDKLMEKINELINI